MPTIRMLACLVLLAPVHAVAETLFVRAQPAVAMLAAPSPEAAVIRRLTPGDPVEVMQREAGYVQVRARDGAQGWLDEAAVTAAVPADRRATALEQEAAELRGQLTIAENNLRNVQAELRRARQAAETARDAGAGTAAELEAENVTLRGALAAREQDLAGLRQRLAELELAQSARLLTATNPANQPSASRGYPPRQIAAAAVAGLALAMLGAWIGAWISRRRLRRRYHGLEL